VLLQQLARAIGAARITVAVAALLCSQEVLARFSAVGGEQQTTELETRAAVDPGASVQRNGSVEILTREHRLSAGGACRAAAVVPQRFFAEHPRPRIARELLHPLVQHALGIRWTFRAEQRRSALEAQQSIARVAVSQRLQLPQR